MKSVKIEEERLQVSRGFKLVMMHLSSALFYCTKYAVVSIFRPSFPTSAQFHDVVFPLGHLRDG